MPTTTRSPRCSPTGRAPSSPAPPSGRSPIGCGACSRHACRPARMTGAALVPDARLKNYAQQAVRHLAAAGSVMVAHQATAGAHSGHVPPWPGAPDPDFHATLAAVWIWARHQRLSGVEKFTVARTAAWNFLLGAAPRFVPDAIDSATDDEAAFDCAMVLWAVAAEKTLGRLDARRQLVADRAARVLSAHLG